jgi:hypothetical protein
MDISLYRREPFRAILGMIGAGDGLEPTRPRDGSIDWSRHALVPEALGSSFSSRPEGRPSPMGVVFSASLRRGFAWLRPSLYDCPVLELEVYAAGVRELNKILELDIELGPIAGLHYKVDRNHDIAYMELEGPTVTFREIRSILRKLGLNAKFVGAIPAELRPKTKTQLLEA